MIPFEVSESGLGRGSPGNSWHVRVQPADGSLLRQLIGVVRSGSDPLTPSPSGAAESGCKPIVRIERLRRSWRTPRRSIGSRTADFGVGTSSPCSCRSSPPRAGQGPGVVRQAITAFRGFPTPDSSGRAGGLDRPGTARGRRTTCTTERFARSDGGATVRLQRSRRGGVLLDAVVAIGLLLLAGFALSHFGLTFSQVASGARHFFTH